jgi:hypothetical protein
VLDECIDCNGSVGRRCMSCVCMCVNVDLGVRACDSVCGATWSLSSLILRTRYDTDDHPVMDNVLSANSVVAAQLPY